MGMRRTPEHTEKEEPSTNSKKEDFSTQCRIKEQILELTIDEEKKAQGESSDEDKVVVLDAFPEKNSMVLRKALKASVEQEPIPSQRETVFLTYCRIGGALCELIVDGGSEANTVSQDLVDSLDLPTTRHPHPYKLSWLDKSKSTGVRRQCSVSFSIGPYEDVVLCDVIPMDACHVLLGRPWQSDKKSIHDGVANTYTITHNKKKITLHPLPPKEVLAPQNKEVNLLTLREIGEEESEWKHLKRLKEEKQEQRFEQMEGTNILLHQFFLVCLLIAGGVIYSSPKQKEKKQPWTNLALRFYHLVVTLFKLSMKRLARLGVILFKVLWMVSKELLKHKEKYYNKSSKKQVQVVERTCRKRKRIPNQGEQEGEPNTKKKKVRKAYKKFLRSRRVKQESFQLGGRFSNLHDQELRTIPFQEGEDDGKTKNPFLQVQNFRPCLSQGGRLVLFIEYNSKGPKGFPSLIPFYSMFNCTKSSVVKYVGPCF